ncbi:MAG: hypothetical protein IPM34_05260 [Saprospiraceae bacterium]|nr:hypothetical protein [Saprospiraceae bacterium]
MKNNTNNLFIAIFLAFISQGIQAQFDDIYYDPDKDDEHVEQRYYSSDQNGTDDRYQSKDERYYDPNESYDDEYGEWEDQDYYYTSRIKRFHRPVYGFNYYDPFYTHSYFYDPFDFDPWYYDRDIYSSSWRFSFYTGPILWTNYYRYRPFWSHWDACYGWNSFGWNSYGGYGGWNNWYWGIPYYHHRDHYYYGNNTHHNDHGSKYGYHYGSRRFGTTNTSKRGPVRLTNPSPRVITESAGVNADPGRTTASPRRIIRSADGDSPREQVQNGRLYNDRTPERSQNPGRTLESEKPGFEKTDRANDRVYDRNPNREMGGSEKYRDERNSDRSKFRPHRTERPRTSEGYRNYSPSDSERRSYKERSSQPDLKMPRQKEKPDHSNFGGAIMDAIGSGGSKGKSNSSSGNSSGKSGKSEGSRKGPR